MISPSRTLLPWILIILCIGFTHCDDGLPDDPFGNIRSSLEVDLTTGFSTMDLSSARANFNNFPFEALSAQEVKGILFVREEEKLSLDYFMMMGDLFTSDILNNIASSELSHFAISSIPLEKYSITDPTLGLGAGVFKSQSLQAHYNELVAMGGGSLLDALTNGTVLQEASLVTIENQFDDVANNRDLRHIYNDLRIATRNHLRIMVAATRANGGTYVPRFLSTEDFQEIITGAFEVG